jgi:hypothetical protein
MVPIDTQGLWEQSARVRRHSRALRQQLADLAEQVAFVEDQSAAIHDARQFAAAERALAWSYRLEPVARETTRRVAPA